MQRNITTYHQQLPISNMNRSWLKMYFFFFFLFFYLHELLFRMCEIHRMFTRDKKRHINTHLWKFLFYENGRWKQLTNDESVYMWKCFALLCLAHRIKVFLMRFHSQIMLRIIDIFTLFQVFFPLFFFFFRMPLASFRSTYDTYCLLLLFSHTWDKKETLSILYAHCSRGLNMHKSQISRNVKIVKELKSH